MSKKVWVTTSNRQDNLRMFGLSFGDKFDYPKMHLLEKKIKRTKEEQEEWLKMLDHALEINKPYNACKRIDTSIIPTILYGHSIRKDIEFPSFCRTPEGYLLINEECANILKCFRLGETEMYPVSFFDLDLNEPVNDKTYYFLNIAEWRNYLLPEFSTKRLKENSKLNEDYKEYRLYHSRYEDKAIAVSVDALNCNLDLWHDPALLSSIFMSDELKKALDDAQLSDAWQLFLCDLK